MTNVGSVFVTVIPSARGFTKKLKSQLDKDLSKLGKEMGSDFSDSLGKSLSEEFSKSLPKTAKESGSKSAKAFGGAFERQIKKSIGGAIDNLGDVEIGVSTSEADQRLKDLRASLMRLGDQQVGVDISSEQALAEISNIERDLTELNASTPDIDVRANTGAALTELAVLQAAVSKLDGSDIDVNTNVSGLRDAQFAVSGLATTIAALGPAIVPVAAAVGGLGAALGAPLAAAGGGLGLYAIFTGQAISRLKETQKEIKRLRTQASTTADPKRAAALSAAADDLESTLSSGERGFLKAQSLLGSTFDKFIDQNTDAIFGPVNTGLNLLSKTLPLLEPVITAVSGSLTRMLASIGDSVSSPGFQSFVKAFASTAATALDQFFIITKNVGKGLFNVFKGFKPLADQMMNGLVRLTGAFAKWSASASGKNSIAGFVEYAQRVGPKVVATFGSIIKAVVNLGKALAPIGEFALAGIKTVADLISNMPVGVLRTLIGLLIAGVVAVKALNVANKVYNLVLAAQTKGTFANAVATRVSAAATKGMALAQRLLNVVLRASPLGLLVTGLTLVGLALFAAYKKSETFRNVVNAVFGAVKTAIGVAVNFIKTHLKQIGTALLVLAGPVGWFVLLIIKNFSKVRAAIGFLGRVFKGLWNNVVKPVFGWIGARVNDVWEDMIKPAFNALRSGVGRISDAFETARSKISTAWEKIRNAVKKPIKFVVENVINRLVGGVNKLLPGNPLKKISTEGWRTGGYTGRLNPNAVAGLVHGDEHVIRSGSRRQIEKKYPGLLDHMNKFGEVPGYKSGGRVYPVKGSKKWTSYKGHTGIDFPRASGTPVYAATAGKVTATPRLATSYGHHVRQNGAGGSSIYGHLSKILVKVGQTLKAGQMLGKVGSTGNSTGPHLHFERRPPGTDTGTGAFLNGAATPTGKAVEEKTGVFAWLKSKFDFTKKMSGWLGAAKGKGGIFGDSLRQFASSAGTKIWDAIKDKIGNLKATAKNMGKSVVGKISGFFDQGGVANGTGFLAKNTIAPERVLNPHETGLFESLVGSLIGIDRSPVASNVSSVARSGPYVSAIRILNWEDGMAEITLMAEDAVDGAVQLSGQLNRMKA